MTTRKKRYRNYPYHNAHLLNTMLLSPHANAQPLTNITHSHAIPIPSAYEQQTTPELQAMNAHMKAKASKYRIVKYLGDTVQGEIYLAVDTANNKYIYKKIIFVANPEVNNQLDFELKILNYLSNNRITREYVNPCLEYSFERDNAYAIFPIYNGYSLEHYRQYLARMSPEDYFRLVFLLIKNILHGMAKIHQTHIAHQNITENAILVSSVAQDNNIATPLQPQPQLQPQPHISHVHVKFTDFGLGCSHPPPERKYQKDIYFNTTLEDSHTCKVKGNVPIEITQQIEQVLEKSDYLKISQKYDLLCLGMIFIKILLIFDKLDVDLAAGYSIEFIKNVKHKLIEKYFAKHLRYSQLFTNAGISNTTKKSILEYLKLFIKYIFCKTNERQTCQYILDKLIIYEKYMFEG